MRLYRQEKASSSALIIITSSVLSVLGTRLFLEATGYPIIGKGMWHLSHTIWGGCLMIMGMFLIVSFYGRKVTQLACAVFGLGVGMFVDELGKFVTKDNNYFFKPTSMMIYILFLVLVGVHRLLSRRAHENGIHLFYHILDRLGDLAENDLDDREQKKLVEIVQLLKKRAHYELITFSHELEKALTRLSPTPYKQSVVKRLTRKVLGSLYRKILVKKGVLVLLIIIATGYSLASMVDTIWIFFSLEDGSRIPNLLGEYSPVNGFETYLLAVKVLSDFLIAGLFLIGIGSVTTKKYKIGLEFFEDGLLIYILLTTVCRFYFEQFSAVLGLLFSLAMLLFVKRMKLEKIA